MAPRIITTVVTPAASHDLVTLAEVKADLAITDTGSDALLATLIRRASAAIEQACNRIFVVETITDRIWPERDPYPAQVPGGVRVMQLSRWPLVSVAEVKEHDEVLVQDTHYLVDAQLGQITRLNVAGVPVDWGMWGASITYTAGFATIPADLADACSRLVKARFMSAGRDERLTQETIPGVIERRWWVASGADAGNLTPDVADIIENYRVPVVG